MDDLKAVIERLEKAEEGGRELDARIAYYVNFGDPEFVTHSWREVVELNGFEKAIDKLSRFTSIWSTILPKYTTSIDAAMTLVPEGASWRIEADHAWITMAGHDDVLDYQAGFCRKGGKCTALALCIAALKARSPEQGDT